MARRVFVTVAEVSGDQHAAELVRALKELDPDIQVEALGGPQLRQAGAVIHHETTSRAVMGFGAIGRAVEVWRLLKWTDRHYAQSPPDLHICVDSFAMNASFAKLARRHGVPVLYYIPPQLWGSRAGRIKKLRAYATKVACIQPFEEQYLRDRGVDATFVGIPLFDELPPQRRQNDPEPLDGRPPVVGLLCGSRRGEVLKNLPHMLDVADRIRSQFPGAKFLLATTGPTHELVLKMLAGREGFEAYADRVDELVPRCDLCITKSGTATLHVAAHGVPMIVVYRGSILLWHLLGRWIIKVRTFALVNLLAGRHIVPEFVPWHGSNAPVAELAIDLLKDPRKRAIQRRDILELMEKIDRPGASRNAARLALEMMNRP